MVVGRPRATRPAARDTWPPLRLSPTGPERHRALASSSGSRFGPLEPARERACQAGEVVEAAEAGPDPLRIDLEVGVDEDVAESGRERQPCCQGRGQDTSPTEELEHLAIRLRGVSEMLDQDLVAGVDGGLDGDLKVPLCVGLKMRVGEEALATGGSDLSEGGQPLVEAPQPKVEGLTIDQRSPPPADAGGPRGPAGEAVRCRGTRSRLGFGGGSSMLRPARG